MKRIQCLITGKRKKFFVGNKIIKSVLKRISNYTLDIKNILSQESVPVNV